MELNRIQFDILVFLGQRKNGKKITQRDIAYLTGHSLGAVNKALVCLNETNLIKNNSLSSKGFEALEPYRVKRAIFAAAGFGSRLVPITLNTPKPLVRVKGMRIIDTLLDAVCAVGIEQIIIVRGYLSEQFDQLKNKYPNIQFLENPLYNETNNISSLMCARKMLQNAYILESDLLLRNPKLICKYHYTSNYLGVKTEYTDDWCLKTRNGIITKMQLGGKNCYHMFGISYWNKEDGIKLSRHLKQVYEMPGGKENFWDQTALEYFIKDYSVEVRECSFDDIVEIDTFNELKKLDETYRV
jgi:CTP:phosphocholine cytidylyltransferase-like protein